MSTEAVNPTPPAPPPPPPAPSAPPPSLDELRSAALALVLGLGWGALMLFVFGLWIRWKHAAAGATMSTVFFVAAAAAAVACGWQVFALWFKKETPEQKAQTLNQLRQYFSFGLMGTGLGLIVVAFLLGGLGRSSTGTFSFDLKNFGETVGALVFGLVALGGGYVLQIAGSAELTNPVKFLVDKVPMLKLVTIVVGVACLGGFIYLTFVRKIDHNTWMPELAALLFMSVLCAGCMFWLNSGEMKEDSIRQFVLVFGGATGLILFFLSLGRAYKWRESILGITAWQGPDAWRFWLCAYLFFFALVLMFLCFNLARADIRTHASLRRLLYGYDSIAQSLLLIGILLALNVVVYAMMPFTYDWTSARGIYDLSPSTKSLIGGLKVETHLVALMPEAHPIQKDLRILLDNIQALNSNVKVQFINPRNNFEDYEKYARRFRQILPVGGQPQFGVLIVHGAIPEKDENVPHAFVAVHKLFDERQPMMEGEKPKRSFTGEGEIMKELKFLLDGRTKRKIYILQGNDEPGLDKRGNLPRFGFQFGIVELGISALVDKLQQENYDVSGLSFLPEAPAKKGEMNIVHAEEDPIAKRKAIPKDCHTLIIAGPSKLISREIIDAVRDHADRGGKILAFIDVFTTPEGAKFKETGMETLLGHFGVDVTDDIPIWFPERAGDNLLDVMAQQATSEVDSQNPLARSFMGDRILMPRGVRALQPGKTPGRYKTETILQIDTRLVNYVVEKNVTVLRDPRAHMQARARDSNKLRRDFSLTSIPVVVAVSEANGEKPVMVVFGDTEFITNPYMRESPTQVEAYTFVAGALEWVAGREAFGARPKDFNTYTMKESARQNASRMVWVPFWLMCLTVLGLGTMVWVIRRR